MSEMSNYTGVFRAELTDGRRKVWRRGRQPLSCTSCRSKKLKCDRQQPCNACSKRGDAAACRFSSGSTASIAQAKESTKAEAQARLQRLEEMVNQLISSNSKPAPDAVDNKEQTVIVEQQRTPPFQASEEGFGTTTGGHMRGQGTDSIYRGATHWAAILESIHDIRGYLNSDDDVPAETQSELTMARTDFVLGAPPNATKAELFSTLPPRPICDRVLSIYFNERMIAGNFIHSGKFQRDYELVWKDPSAASWMLISLTFSLVWQGFFIAKSRGLPTGLDDQSHNPRLYMAKARQCLVAGEYFKPQPYVIEALMLHSRCMFLQMEDPDPTLWSIFGMMTRLAQRMGYHRDGKFLSESVTPFEAEMRRRQWFYIETFDLALSFQLGMPPIIHEEECDTASPSHLLDEDFDEDCKVLPPSRPFSQPTSMLSYCIKSRFIRLFRRVVRLALSTKEPPCDDVCNLHRELEAEHRNLPPSIKMRPIRSFSFADTACEILHKAMIELLYQKSLCMLHRRYLGCDKDNPKFEASREICVAAALRILEYQAEFYVEFQPGGRLHDDRWTVNNLAQHDFLLAAMIICLHFSEGHPTSQEDRTRKLSALKTSYDIWCERSTISADAARAAKIVAVILRRASGKEPHEIPSSLSNYSSPGNGLASFTTPPSSISSQYHGFDGVDLNNAAQDQITQSFRDGLPDYTGLEPLDTILNQSDGLNWNIVDQYIFDRRPEFESGLDLQTSF